MDNEVTVVCWMKLEVDIACLRRCLVSIALLCIGRRQIEEDTHCHIHFEDRLDQRRFSRADLLRHGINISLDRNLRGRRKINTFPTTRIRNLQSSNATKDTIESRTHLKRSGSTRRNSEGSVLVLPVVFVFFDGSVCFLICSSRRYWRYVGQTTITPTFVSGACTCHFPKVCITVLG